MMQNLHVKTYPRYDAGDEPSTRSRITFESSSPTTNIPLSTLPQCERFSLPYPNSLFSPLFNSTIRMTLRTVRIILYIIINTS